MADSILVKDKEYNVQVQVHGNGILDEDTQYIFVDALPTSDIRQDTFYKVSGQESLYWWTGSMWVDLTQVILKSGISFVNALPTTDINNELIYSVTNSGVLHYYTGNTSATYDASKWVDISTEHIVAVANPKTSVTSPKQTVIYYDTSSSHLYWNNGTKWIDLDCDHGVIECYTVSDVSVPVPNNLYYESSTKLLWWYDGTNWNDIVTEHGIVIVDALPTTGMRQDCFYQKKTGTDKEVYWWNGSKWLDVTHIPTIICMDTPPYEMTTGEDDHIYNYSGDDYLWWYNSHSAKWVNIVSNDAITIVNGLPTADLRSNYLYYDISQSPPTIFWWNGSKWIEVSTNYGIVEVASISTLTDPRRDCFYAEPDQEEDSLYWYDGAHWNKVAKHPGIKIVTSIPSASDADVDCLYYVNGSSAGYDGGLWWYDPKANVWHNLALNNGIVEVSALPTTGIRTDCIYKSLADNHIYYYYAGAWQCLDYNYGINIVDALPTTNIPMDKLYKIRTSTALYWYNGNRWVDVSSKGGLTSVSTLPTTPPDTDILYRLTADQYSGTSLQYEMGIYVWLDSKWVELKAVDADKGIVYNGTTKKIEHSNSITAGTASTLRASVLDAQGHVSSYTELGWSANSDVAYKFSVDSSGNMTAVTALSVETWKFTLADGTTVQRKVYLEVV